MKLCIWPKWELRDGGARMPLCPQEGLLMLALLGRPHCTIEDLCGVLWADPDLEPEWGASIIKKIMCVLRQKVRRFGWDIPDGRAYHGCGQQRQWNGYRLVELPEEWRLAA